MHPLPSGRGDKPPAALDGYRHASAQRQTADRSHAGSFISDACLGSVKALLDHTGYFSTTKVEGYHDKGMTQVIAAAREILLPTP